MSGIEQVPFGDSSALIEFANNPDPRIPCILLLDSSGSMAGRKIDELNAGVVMFKDEVLKDAKAARSVEIAVISFGPVQVVNDFVSPVDFVPPLLVAGNDTPMGEAINQALELLESRKRVYRASGIDYYRPWIFLITDGSPTDSWAKAAQKIKEYEQDSKVVFFAVGVEGADFATLGQISVRPPLKAKGLVYREMFAWLSNSLGAVSKSQPGDRVHITPPEWII